VSVVVGFGVLFLLGLVVWVCVGFILCLMLVNSFI